MGYFSNGTSGAYYQDDYCFRCKHWRLDDTGTEGCPVWDAHLIHNYSECNKADSILHFFIPRNGVKNLACTMFISRTKSKRTRK